MKRCCLVGNPNCGKTTLFNSLTGSTAHVGNWPGVTVDKKEGIYRKCENAVSVIDLPGIYSLSPYTSEEVIARNYILDEKPDCVINIVDATNLERNLYLTTQIMEIDVPIVVALNMIDVVEKTGDKINEKQLEERLGIPVVKVSALRETGIIELMERVYSESNKTRTGVSVLENCALSRLIRNITVRLKEQSVENPLFHAIKFIENDDIEKEKHKETVSIIDEFKKTFNDDVFEKDFEAFIADERYKYISKNFGGVIVRKNRDKVKMTKSDKIDKVLTHKIWSIPIFLVILFSVFHLTFSENFLFLDHIFNLPTLEELGVNTKIFGGKILACIYDGAVFSPGVIISNLWNELIVGEIFGYLCGLVNNSAISPWIVGLVVNGIFEGLSSVLSFLPQIIVLFLFFSILEDSGYMARTAFILDRVFRKFGLSGRSFMPMIMGFGCSVPAMMNARTLADDKERIATIRVIPFFSCSAKVPVLTAVAGAIVAYFGVGNADLITFGMYVLGVATAIVAVLFMRNTSLKGDTSPFIMELPAYHLPKIKNLLLHLWDKVKHFIQKAFTIILASTVLIWVLSHFSMNWLFLKDEEINLSILAQLASLIQPIFTPLGFGSQLEEYGWAFVVAVVAGLVAKENIISTFATIGSCLFAVANFNLAGFDIVEDVGVRAVGSMITSTNISIPALISFIAFNMTTIPCFAAIGTAKAELQDKKKFKWTLVFWLFTSYSVSCMIYTIGSWWWTVFIWLLIIILSGLIIRCKNKRIQV